MKWLAPSVAFPDGSLASGRLPLHPW